MEFKASLDTLSKALTAGVFILLITIGQKSVRALTAAHGETILILVHGGILLLFVAILFGSYMYSVRSYSVTDDELIIQRPIGNRVIVCSDIKEIRKADKTEFSGTIRTFGNGGLFGYYGKFYNAKLGNMTWYVTQRKNSIIMLMKTGEKIIISPDDISMFDKIQAVIKHSDKE